MLKYPSMQNVLLIVQIIISAFLVVAIILQNRGGGLGSIFGGESAVYRSKRGVEKLLHYATIGLAVVFSVLSLSSVLLF